MTDLDLSSAHVQAMTVAMPMRVSSAHVQAMLSGETMELSSAHVQAMVADPPAEFVASGFYIVQSDGTLTKIGP